MSKGKIDLTKPENNELFGLSASQSAVTSKQASKPHVPIYAAWLEKLRKALGLQKALKIDDALGAVESALEAKDAEIARLKKLVPLAEDGKAFRSGRLGQIRKRSFKTMKKDYSRPENNELFKTVGHWHLR